ncbi:hypothetical protein [Blastococcus sp. SYSU D00695]
MISTTFPCTPALVAGVLDVRPASAAGAWAAPSATPVAVAAAPRHGTRVPSTRLRALIGGMAFGAGTATEQHVDDIAKKNTSTLGIHSPGRPLS